MCVVSNVSDYYQRQWSLPGRFISEGEWQEYQRLKKMAEEIDKKTNQPDCVKPELAEWEKRVEEVLRKNGILK